MLDIKTCETVFCSLLLFSSRCSKKKLFVRPRGGERGREQERERETDTDRQTDRQTATHRDRDREAERKKRGDEESVRRRGLRKEAFNLYRHSWV